MSLLPNPFLDSASVSLVETAAVSQVLPFPGDAAASRFVLDERAFMEALDPPPAFLDAPRYEFLEIIEQLARF